MWKEIKGYEGYYEVSDNGEVRSLDRFIPHSDGSLHFRKGQTMKQTPSTGRDGSQGYLVVNLRKNHMSWVAQVHRLVAMAFIPNPHNLPTVNHIDGNKHNNKVSNLEWVSYGDNNIHALSNGLRQPRGVKILQYSLDGDFINCYRSVCEASRITGCSRGGISHCINGRCSTSNGFIWRKLLGSATTIPQGSTTEDELPLEAQELSDKTEDIVYAVSNNG